MSDHHYQSYHYGEPIHLYGVIDVSDNSQKFHLVKLHHAVNLMQIRILRKDLRIDIRGNLFISKTQSSEIEQLCFFVNNLKQPQASRYELLSRINRLERLTSKDCVIPIEDGRYDRSRKTDIESMQRIIDTKRISYRFEGLVEARPVSDQTTKSDNLHNDVKQKIFVLAREDAYLEQKFKDLIASLSYLAQSISMREGKKYERIKDVTDGVLEINRRTSELAQKLNATLQHIEEHHLSSYHLFFKMIEAHDIGSLKTYISAAVLENRMMLSMVLALLMPDIFDAQIFRIAINRLADSQSQVEINCALVVLLVHYLDSFLEAKVGVVVQDTDRDRSRSSSKKKKKKHKKRDRSSSSSRKGEREKKKKKREEEVEVDILSAIVSKLKMANSDIVVLSLHLLSLHQHVKQRDTDKILTRVEKIYRLHQSFDKSSLAHRIIYIKLDAIMSKLLQPVKKETVLDFAANCGYLDLEDYHRSQHVDCQKVHQLAASLPLNGKDIISNLYSLNSWIDHIEESLKVYAVDYLVASDYTTLLVLMIHKKYRDAKFDEYDPRMIEAISGRVSKYVHVGCDKWYQSLRYLNTLEGLFKKVSKLSSVPNLRIKHYLYDILQYTSRDTLGERNKEKDIKRGMIFTTSAYDCIPKIVELVDKDYMYIMMVLYEYIFRMQRNLAGIDELMEADHEKRVALFDVVVHLIESCSHTIFASKVKAISATKVKSSLIILLRCLELYQQKVAAVGRSNQIIVYGSHTIDLLINLYSTELEGDLYLQKTKQELDSKIHAIIFAIASTDDFSNKADRCMNRLLHNFVTKNLNNKLMVLLHAFLKGAKRRTDKTSVVNTLIRHSSEEPPASALVSMSDDKKKTFIFDMMIHDSHVLGLVVKLIAGFDQCPISIECIHYMLDIHDSEIYECMYITFSELIDSRKLPIQRVICLLIQASLHDIFKSYSVQEDMLIKVMRSIDKNDQDSLVLFIEYATILIDRKIGMTYSCNQDKDRGKYIFEDIPKESEIETVVKFVCDSVQSFESDAVVQAYLRLILAMCNSSVCQLILLYGGYTERVRSKAMPLVSLDRYASDAALSADSTALLLSIMYKMLHHPTDNSAYKENRRLNILSLFVFKQQLAKQDIICFVDSLSSRIEDLRVTSLCELLKPVLSQCGEKSDSEKNEVGRPSRDFKERFPIFLDRHKSSVKKFKESYGEDHICCNLREALSVLLYRFNQDCTEPLAEDDFECRQRTFDLIEKSLGQNYNVTTSPLRWSSALETAKQELYETVTDSLQESEPLLKVEMTAPGVHQVDSASPITFRLVESISNVQEVLRRETSHQSQRSTDKPFSSRHPSKHVDEFQSSASQPVQAPPKRVEVDPTPPSAPPHPPAPAIPAQTSYQHGHPHPEARHLPYQPQMSNTPLISHYHTPVIHAHANYHVNPVPPQPTIPVGPPAMPNQGAQIYNPMAAQLQRQAAQPAANNANAALVNLIKNKIKKSN